MDSIKENEVNKLGACNMGMLGKYQWTPRWILIVSIITIAIVAILALLYFNIINGAAILLFVLILLIFNATQPIPTLSIENDKLVARQHSRCITVDRAQNIITVKSGPIFKREQIIPFDEIESIERLYEENHECSTPDINYTVSINIMNPERCIELFVFRSTESENSACISMRFIDALMGFTGKRVVNYG